MTSATVISTTQYDEPRTRSFSQRRHQVQHIGNYVIHKKTLGSGSMGTVKLAECLSDKDHQQYAVKIMPKINLNIIEEQKNKDPKDTPREREQRTIREMAIMHLLRHPNICQLKEWVVHGDHYYMFLEYIEGGQLLDYIISHGKLREKLARKFARQIVSALDYCHRNSIVHRDLKIENILITHNEEIKIIDFGLSNIYSPSRLLNTFCGSLYFAAPELLQARNYTGPEVDVWSFGVVLYVLVCGRVPFDDTSLPALHQKIKAGLVEYPEHLSRECVDLLSKILVVDPKRRETLSFVIHHPWMNRGYDEPIFNHLPHRQPLKSIDPTIIQGMQGFGLGSPEEIQTKLQRIISSSEYQYAANQIDHNYQQQQQQQQQHQHQQQHQSDSLTKWRRTISIKRNNSPIPPKRDDDDPQSLPAMYDPLVSIYALVKERREFDEIGYKSPVKLGRSASTSLTTSTTKSNYDIRRRKTERVPPSHTRNLFKDNNTNDWAAPNNTPNNNNNNKKSAGTTTTTTNTFATTNGGGGTTILQRSRSAAKRIGAMLPSSTKHQQLQESSDEHIQTIENHCLSRESLSTQQQQQNDTNNNSYSSTLKKKISLLRSNSLTDRRHRKQSIKKPNSTSAVEDESMNTQHVKFGSSAPSQANNNGGGGGRFIEEGISNLKQVPKISTHPKSLFNFSRRHLFKMNTVDMMRNLQQVLLKLGIRYLPSPHESFTLRCELSDWHRFHLAAHAASVLEDDDEGLVGTIDFTVMVYQARWAGGRLGIKVLEAEEKDDKVYRSIYHTILNELGSY